MFKQKLIRKLVISDIAVTSMIRRKPLEALFIRSSTERVKHSTDQSIHVIQQLAGPALTVSQNNSSIHYGLAGVPRAKITFVSRLEFVGWKKMIAHVCRGTLCRYFVLVSMISSMQTNHHQFYLILQLTLA